MEKLLNVTTFNILTELILKEERVELLFQELKDHGSEVILLQEVLKETAPLIREKALQEGWHVSEGTLTQKTPQKVFGNVTISRTPITSSFSMPCVDYSNKNDIETLITHFEDNITTINAHLPWGFESELSRLDTVYNINQYAECLKDQEPDRLIIFGGDFNTSLSSSTMRYLRGEDIYKESSTFWTSAWDSSDTVFPTSRKDGGWAEITATSVGISHPELMPNRTVDHLLTFDWNYGKKHHPISMKKFGESTLSNGFGLSDHYGITAKITL